MDTEYMNSLKKKKKKHTKIFKSLFRQGKKITSLMKKKTVPGKKKQEYSLLQTSLAWTVSENQ